MANGFRYYRALESVSITLALSTALIIYPCQIRVHQRWQSKLQLGRRSGGQPQRAVHPHAVTCQHCDTHYMYFSRPRATTFRSLVDCWSDALPVVPLTHPGRGSALDDNTQSRMFIVSLL